MSDSGSSSMSGETRMLERRVSNNRSELSGDQQTNYFLAWFATWSELQKTDFVPVLAAKMSGDKSDGIPELLAHTHLGPNRRPPSLFACQVKLFHDWFSGWSDDHKSYLALRLKDIDGEFFERYEQYLQFGKDSIPKDYFEPGMPNGIVTPVNGLAELSEEPEVGQIEPEEEEEEEDDDLKKRPLYASEPVPEMV